MVMKFKELLIIMIDRYFSKEENLCKPQMSCLSTNPSNQFLSRETCETTCVRDTIGNATTTAEEETTTESAESTTRDTPARGIKDLCPPDGDCDPCTQKLDAKPAGYCWRPRLRWVGVPCVHVQVDSELRRHSLSTMRNSEFHAKKM